METEDKKQVLFMIDSLGCGGAEKSLISLLPLLDYSKISVDLVVVGRGGAFEQYVPQDVTIIGMPNKRHWWWRICQLMYSLSLRLFRNRNAAELHWMTMGNTFPKHDKIYDVAIAYQQGFPTYYIAEKVTAKRKYAWINIDMKKLYYDECFNSVYYRQFSNVIAVSTPLFSILKNQKYVGNEKMTVIYDILNPVLIRQMADESINDGLPREKCMSEKTFRITTVGRLVYQKGYDLAVDAARILKSNGVSFVWTFVGDGNEREKLNRKIKKYGLENNLLLAGFQSNPYPYIKSADIYVQMSRFEGFGLTVNEAKILNKPIVCTNFPVAHDQIRDGENGLICEMTADDIASKIMMLTENHELRDKLSEVTKKEINTTYITEPQKVMSLILS